MRLNSAEKTVLVTGGAGFVGTNLCAKLLSDGCHVICLDNLNSGSKENILPFKCHDRFEFLRHDVTIPISLEVDEIYNLACPASPPHYQLDPIKTMKVNVIGALNMLALAKSNGAKILQASTSEIYGDPLMHPQVESYWGNVNPIGVRSCYDEGKRAAETLFFDYHRTLDVDIRVIRIFNTYGPKMFQGDGRVVSNFICQALSDQNITIYGDGDQTRSFQYVDDLISGMTSFMALKSKFPGPINIGNPVEFTISELANKVLAMIPESKSKIVYKALPSDDPMKRRPDITVARETLGWEPKIMLEEGLVNTIKHFREVLGVVPS
jgi:UDP-glucuronate decarboxylase